MTGVVVWFTGLPASGKSTLALRVRDHLGKMHRCLILDGDEIRDALGHHAFTAHDRDELYTILARLAALFARQGLIVLVAATAPKRAHREMARALAPAFVEVHVKTPLSECEQRDPKGLYARARAGSLPLLPGVGVPYEAPESPDVIADGALDDAAIAAIEALVLRDLGT